MFLLVIDTYSRWLDVKLMTTTKAEKVINELRVIFAYFMLPTNIVSDSGPPFSSNEFNKFCRNNGMYNVLKQHRIIQNPTAGQNVELER